MRPADLDRLPVVHRFEKWGRDVTFRPLGALGLAQLQQSHPAVDGQVVDADGLVRFHAELLAATVVDPTGWTADEWLECTASTLSDLGQVAMRVSGLVADETKKN